jgi:hypothetical protein
MATTKSAAKQPAKAKTKAKTAGKKLAPTGKASGKKSCMVQDCKRGYRAKGYCFFHYKKWRAGELPHGRYRTCSNAECLKKVAQHGLCEEHFKAWKSSRKGATPAEPPATAAAVAA